MVKIKCSFPDCTYEAEHADSAIVASLLNIHCQTHAIAAFALRTPAPPQPKLDRPRVDIGIEEEVWNGFIRRWEAFRVGSGISEETAPMQLFQCASDALGDLVLKAHPDIQSKTIEIVKQTMRDLAVIPVAIGVRRAELMEMRQSPDEQFRTFAARVQGKAETCSFKTSIKCQCNTVIEVDYTTESVRDVLLAGIADNDIRREALSDIKSQTMSINNVISFVESREMARNATPSASMSAISSFRRKQAEPPPQKKDTPPDASKTAQCPTCKKAFHPFKQRANGTWNSKPHLKCISCWRADRRKPQNVSANTTEVVVSQIGAISRAENQILSKSEIRRYRHSEHPKIELTISHRSRAAVKVTVMAIADSGAMSNLWSLEQYLGCGFKKEDLKPASLDITAANRNRMNIVGVFEAIIQGQSPDGETASSSSPIYVSDSVNDFFLSFETMLDLGILGRAFPTIGAYGREKEQTEPKPIVPGCMIRGINAGCLEIDETSKCSCPLRESVPPKPDKLPFEPTPENNDKMRDWLLDRFSSSTFNTCPHKPLPSMSGPPLEIHVQDNIVPKACHTAAPIPLHWQEQVKNDLIRDEALGVIEKVPYGEPVTWCHRMVVTRKHDGRPRRTVDLSPLNRYCKRETYAAESPFHITRRIPGMSWKTVTDAWNGYHSVPLRECDRHLTTFITPFGRYRYTRAPQGFLSSGDGYNRRFEAILADFDRKERCVDDTCHYDSLDDLEKHWWRTIELLSVCGAAGIVLNPEKFQFAQTKVDFAGFEVSEDKILPLPKYLIAIKSFPTPTSTTDIRSWFGLINQVANYAQLRDMLELFRPFLSPRYKFFWSPVLDRAFTDSKQIIIDAIKEGVQIFDVSKRTCLRPDWSKKGIGYTLIQKHCHCSSLLPDCCTDGWKITLAGSRFLHGAEERYAAIEGEALAVAWGLEQTRYFTQGCKDLLIVTDHKPLTKIFGDRTLDEIANTRLFRLKQRTLPWQFSIEHMPGKTNDFADAMSRYPASEIAMLSTEDLTESMIATSMINEVKNVTAISWERLASDTLKDPQLAIIKNALTSDDETWTSNPNLKEYAKYAEAIYLSNDIVMYQDRVIVPRQLRQIITKNLHAAHQGVSAMERRAQSIVFWPGISADIQQIRTACTHCNTNAPSQAQTPSTPANPPSTPFDMIFADFFDFGGHHYLVIGDRLSGWPEIYSTPSGSANSGARGLIACMRKFFATFGVPEEISSDGGPEFTASETKKFLATWGVRQRISSAYHPQSNGRAEVAVKSVKRLLRANTTASGSLDTDQVLLGLLQLRNTPDPDCHVSPSEIVFGRPLKDSMGFISKLEKFKNSAIKPIWREAWAAKETALRARFVKTTEKLNQSSKYLGPLSVGDKCFVQNQCGTYPKRWDRTGTVVELRPNEQYSVKIDGSGRITTRNRRFLRKFTLASADIQPDLSHRGQIPSSTADEPTLSHSQPTHDQSLLPLQVPVAPQSPPRSYAQPQLQESESCPSFPPDSMTQPYRPPNPMALTPAPPSSTPAADSPRVPAALKRLMSHNKPGLKEDLTLPEEGGRRTRSKQL